MMPLLRIRCKLTALGRCLQLITLRTRRQPAQVVRQRELPRINSTISVLPNLIAKLSGLSPSFLTLFGSAPCARSQVTVSRAVAWSCNKTQPCRNVPPSESHTISTSIPFAIASSASSMATLCSSGSSKYGGVVLSPSFRRIRSPRRTSFESTRDGGWKNLSRTGARIVLTSCQNPGPWASNASSNVSGGKCVMSPDRVSRSQITSPINSKSRYRAHKIAPTAMQACRGRRGPSPPRRLAQ